MKKRNLIISLLAFGGVLLSSCMLARQKEDVVWSKWYDNGNGTHSRHNLNDISMLETEEHAFVLVNTLEEPTEVTPGRAIYSCEKCACKETQVVLPTGNYVFDQKVIDDKYLLERYSQHSASYYMSSKEGAFGDPRYVFEVSDVPSGYTEVDYVESDGREWVDTGVSNDGTYEVSINNSSKNSRLGPDFVELEYIESDGTQFIKTGVFGPAKWTISIQFTKLDVRQLMGYNGSGGNYWGVTGEDSNRNTEEGDYETYTPWSNHVKAGNKDIIIDDFDTNPGQMTRYLNGELAYGPNGVSGDISNVEYQLLALDGAAFCHAKLYEAKVEKNGVLIHDFVPALRREDGSIGLFDYITKRFIENAGAKPFNAGPEIENPYRQIPSEYQEVDYVRSSGNQFIDAQITFNPDDTVSQIVDLELLDNSLIWSGAHYFSQFGYHQDYVFTHKRVTLKQEYSEQHLNTYVDDKIVSIKDFTGQVVSNVKMGIFRLGAKDNTWYNNDTFSSQILYSQKIYKNNELVRDFVPCYRKSDGITGLFDFVSNSFFANQGASPLIKGPEINSTEVDRDFNTLEKADIPDYYYQLNYVESTGLQDLDTGVVGASRLETTLKFIKNSCTQIMGYSDTGGHFFGIGANNKYLNSELEAGNLDNVVVDFSNETTNKGSVKVNDNVISNFDVPDLQERTLKLFSVGTAANKCLVLLYAAKIYQGEKLVRNFVPVMQKQTGSVGLYDLVEHRFYESSSTTQLQAGGIVFGNIKTQNINVFCDIFSNKSHPFSTRISSYKIYKGNEIVRDLLSVIRNIDGVAGLYDLKNNKFYSSNSEYELSYGKIIGHKLDEGTLVRKATHNVGGEVVYKCIYVNEEIHLSTECTAYKITFVSDNGNLSGVKIFNNNDPDNFDMAMVGYTRNLNTFNYSKSGAYIHFEIPKDGHEYKLETTNGKITEVEDMPRQYKITGFTGDAFVSLRLNDSN